CRAGVQGQPEDARAGRALQLGIHPNQGGLRVEGEAHMRIAVPSGISPVKRKANLLGRSSIALRSTSSRSLLWQRTVPARTARVSAVCGSPINTHSEGKRSRISSTVNTFSMFALPVCASDHSRPSWPLYQFRPAEVALR